MVYSVRRTLSAFALALAMAGWASPADPAQQNAPTPETAKEPLTIEVSRALLATFDEAALEAAFAGLDADFADGRISGKDFDTVYGAFFVSDPERIATIERWRDAAPETAAPHAALAKVHSHIAAVYRGKLYARQVPPTQMTAARKHWSIALAHAERALELDPGHLAAADVAGTIGQWMSRPELIALKDDLWRAHETELDRLRTGVHRRLPQWGGSMSNIEDFCRLQAPLVTEVSLDECLALGVVTSNRGDRPLHRASLAVLEADTDGVFVYTVFGALMRVGERDKAVAYAEKVDLKLGYNDLRRLPREAPIVRRRTELW
ncbi:MAG: DUF4034 domain-containing protein, partial [Pseudomonadota bacterium]